MIHAISLRFLVLNTDHDIDLRVIRQKSHIFYYIFFNVIEIFIIKLLILHIRGYIILIDANFFCRTFLTTLEITVICVFTVIIVFLIVGLVIYVYFYGWTIPQCCKKRNKDYSKVQLQRERKISEIWKNNYWVCLC